ncbi:MAG: hypothetical protein OES09_08100 [Gammaproteobacteria bacterium]|nr:hypothetical protein [Gammaproteobacteria bacterium]
MALTVHSAPASTFTDAEIRAWREIPASIIGDELNRGQIMQAAIKPVTPGMAFAGPAITVRCMVGDNLALHHALTQAARGRVLVVDARSHEDTAVWGEILHTAARQRGVAGIVIDGAARDVGALRRSDLPVFVRAVVPSGPHKGFGGEINAPIQCGGVPVEPGDLVIGDDDGVAVVRPNQLTGLLGRCQKRLRREAEVLARVRGGASTVELLGLPAPEEMAD